MIVGTTLHILDRNIDYSERAVQNAHHLAHHYILDQRQLLLRNRLGAQTLDLGVDLVQSILACRLSHLSRNGQITRAIEIDHTRKDAIGVSSLLAQIAHQTRAEISAQNRRNHLHTNIIGVIARE